jgi:hypothetical protein
MEGRRIANGRLVAVQREHGIAAGKLWRKVHFCYMVEAAIQRLVVKFWLRSYGT